MPPRPEPASRLTLGTLRDRCWVCSGPMWVAYHNRRTVHTLDGLVRLVLPVRRCRNPECERYRAPYRPEGEGSYALPHGEFGIDVIALVGALRFAERRSVPEIHAELVRRGVGISERAVTEQLHRYEELVALRLADQERLKGCLAEQGSVVLAPGAPWAAPAAGRGARGAVGAARLPLRRDTPSSQLVGGDGGGVGPDDRGGAWRAAGADRGRHLGWAALDTRRGRRGIARRTHQLRQFHYLREAAKPLYEADRHAKEELKKAVRGVRPIERALETRGDAEAEAVRGYCRAVRSALTDDGRPPLCASGLKLRGRLEAIDASIERVAEKGGFRRN